jgi:hypothetical protein
MALLFAAALTACHKPEQPLPEPQNETVEVAIDQNTTYEYDLGPVPVAMVEISAPATHGSLSRVTALSGSTSTIYQYVPDSLFTGTDEVTLLLPPPPPKHKKKEHGSCNGGEKPHPPKNSLTIKFTIGHTAAD